MTGKPEPAMPPWWPRGCDETLVRECNCDHCRQLVDALEDHRDGKAIDGEHRTLDAYTERAET